MLTVSDLKVHFDTRRGVGKAVDGVSFHIDRGETLGLVGESGSGKSVTALAILGLHPKPAARIAGGEIIFDGQDLVKMTPKEMRRYRGEQLSMILQDPMTSLNPVLTIGDQVGETIRVHRDVTQSQVRKRVTQLLQLLHIPDPEARLGDYPHQFSGGMRQRVVGAIALAADPELLIADEPTTSLDVTLQAAFLAHLRQIQTQRRLGILFITHDFSVIAKMCDRVAVMYAGRVVETAPTADLMDSPRHPYTQALLRSIPDVERGTERLESIDGKLSTSRSDPGPPPPTHCASPTSATLGG